MIHSIFSFQRHCLLSKIMIGFSLLCLANTPLLAAKKWPITPYGTFHSGVRFATDWSSPWNFQKKPILGSQYSYPAQDKLYPTGVPIFAGVGALVDPSLLEDWMASFELMYHGRLANLAPVPRLDQQGAFIAAKCTFPQSEGVENFIGLGVGGLYLPKLLTEEEKGKKETGNKTSSKQASAIGYVLKETGLSLVVIGYAGRNWHLTNGHYLTLRGTYFFPTGEKRMPSFNVTLGYYVYLV